METISYLEKEDCDKLPTTTGVYSFVWPKNETVYIGKAINLRQRVKNHFSQPTYKDNLYLQKVEKIGFIETGSEIEALVLEAELIKKYQPKFNAVWRDDKNYFYVAITKGPRPFVITTHQPKKQLAVGSLQPGKRSGGRSQNLEAHYIGPFTEGTALKITLKLLRKVFPYYTSPKHPEKKCTWCHLGLCPGPLLGQDSGRQSQALIEYKKNLKKLALILQGKRKTVLYALRKEMIAASNSHKFEEAAERRDKITALERIMAHVGVIARSNIAMPDAWSKTEKLLQEILGIPASAKGSGVAKIECYDISNIQGAQAVGSMVVFVNGKSDKNQYKKFRIRRENTPNDIAMLQEVLVRRLAHPEWPYPDIMLIDGGIAQLNIALKARSYKSEAKGIKVISIAKGKRELLIEGLPKIALKDLPQEVYNLIVHLDDEAHRFAITYHKKLRKKALLESN